MNLLDDPELVKDFCLSSRELIENMESILEQFEEGPEDTSLLEKYGALVDRIMGAAKTMGAIDIGTVCELGKLIGYKASQTDDVKLNLVAAGVLLDSVDLLNDMFNCLEDKAGVKKYSTTAFISRLKWLSDKFKHIDRASVSMEKTAVKKKSSAKTTSELDALIKKFGG